MMTREQLKKALIGLSGKSEFDASCDPDFFIIGEHDADLRQQLRRLLTAVDEGLSDDDVELACRTITELRTELAAVREERDIAYNKGWVESHDSCAKHFDTFGLQQHREQGYHHHQLISCVQQQLTNLQVKLDEAKEQERKLEAKLADLQERFTL